MIDNDYGAISKGIVRGENKKARDLMGLVIGHYGVESPDLQLLCRSVAADSAAANCQRFGCYSQDTARSVIEQWLKYRWAICEIRWKPETILRSLVYVGGSSQAQAASRRSRTESQENQWEPDRQRWEAATA